MPELVLAMQAVMLAAIAKYKLLTTLTNNVILKNFEGIKATQGESGGYHVYFAGSNRKTIYVRIRKLGSDEPAANEAEAQTRYHVAITVPILYRPLQEADEPVFQD
jgi:hypothetical protein